MGMLTYLWCAQLFVMVKYSKRLLFSAIEQVLPKNAKILFINKTLEK